MSEAKLDSVPGSAFGFSNLPRSISLLGREIKIEAERNPDYFGTWDASSSTIRIDKSLTGERLVEILIHEVLHALWTLTGLKRASTEEKIVSQFAVGLTDFLVGHHAFLSDAYLKFTLVGAKQMELICAADGGAALCRNTERPDADSFFANRNEEVRFENKEKLKEALREVLSEQNTE